MTKPSEIIKNPNMRILFGVTFMVVLGVTSITPAFPSIMRELGLTAAAVGQLITAFTVPGVLFTPFIGMMADRYGRKRVLAPSLCLFGLAGMACAFTSDFSTLLIMRFVQGTGAAALGVLNVTVISDMYEGRERSAALGLNAGVLSMGVAIYPVLGGVLTMLSWHVPFILPVLALPLAWLVQYRLESPEPRSSQSMADYIRSTWLALKHPQILACLVATCAHFVILYGPFLNYMPVLLDQRFDSSAMIIGAVMSISALATGAIASQLGLLTGFISESRLLAISFLCYAASMILMPYMPGQWYYLFPSMLLGLGQGLGLPSLQSILAEHAPIEYRAGFMSVNGMSLRLGQTVGPLIMAGAFALSGMTGVFMTGLVLSLAVSVLCFAKLK